LDASRPGEQGDPAENTKKNQVEQACGHRPHPAGEPPAVRSTAVFPERYAWLHGISGWTGYGTRVLRTRRPSPRRTYCSRRVSTTRTSSATGPTLLVREDTGQLLAGQDLAPDGTRRASSSGIARALVRRPTASTAATARTEFEPALSGTYRVTRAGEETVSCRPALELLGELALVPRSTPLAHLALALVQRSSPTTADRQRRNPGVRS
jgi:hypothetical protein